MPRKEETEKDCNLNELHYLEMKREFGRGENQCFIFETYETY